LRLAEANRRTELKRKERTRYEGIRSADALRDDVGVGPRDGRGGGHDQDGHERRRRFARTTFCAARPRPTSSTARPAPTSSIYGGAGGDTIVGGWGRDRIVGGEGRDHIAAGEVHDRVFGNQGRDRIRARDATRDIVDCGKGADRVLVDPRDELRSCELRVRP
jgi:Ca2+-binding RTX toxin-like protein